MGRKIRVGLVYGGRSGEHEVSLQTALSVARAFDYGRYELIPFFIDKQGKWRSGPPLTAPPESVEQLMLGPGEAGAAAGGDIHPATGASAIIPFVRGMLAEAEREEAGREEDGPAIDVMFPLLHGTFGEDGTIQGLFEMAGVPYVGAGVLASAAGMDKVIMKQLFRQAGLPVANFIHFTKYEWNRDRERILAEAEERLGYPCFVKPANLGSSVGVSKARKREELAAAIEKALQFDRKVLVEEFIDAREIEVSVLGNDEPRASVPGEIVSSNEYYDYNAKYVDGKSVMIIPAEIPPETAEEARAMAVRAFRAIDCSGLCRADFFLRRSDGKLLINEVNTMPGFTQFSMYPQLWKASGLSYPELLDELIRLALERFRERQSLKYGERE
ncbi:MAG TPA: D-alanine--D-alanine ligase [Paenibacillaceae bacterium]